MLTRTAFVSYNCGARLGVRRVGRTNRDDRTRNVADPANENASSDPTHDFDEFVALVRTAMHDFNNVLTSMMGWAELGQTLDLDERAVTYMKDIFQAGKRGQELVHGVQERLLEIGQSATRSPSTTTSVTRDSPQRGLGADPAADTP